MMRQASSRAYVRSVARSRRVRKKKSIRRSCILILAKNLDKKFGELHSPENIMAGLLDRRDHVLPFAKQTLITPRPPTPPQTESNEVDDAGSMDYRIEENRLRSFEGWPSPYVRPRDLAAAGFFYTKQIDRVRCFECGTEICRWEDGDNPMSEHQRWGGRCRFIRKQPCGNVPIGVDVSSIPPRPRDRDVCGRYNLDYRPNAEADTHASSSGLAQQQHPQQRQLPSDARLGALGIGIAKKPDFPDFAGYEARLQTFKNWPISIAQTKEQLSDAGFFYTGTGDQTTCYHCGGGLQNWEPQDDPWAQHAKWFSTCPYVRLVKGQEFINSITGKYVPPLSEEEAMRLDLPSCIKKVEIPAQIKQESTEESTSQQSQAPVAGQSQEEDSENNSELSCSLEPTVIECPCPKPRTSIQIQKDVTQIPQPETSNTASSAASDNQQKRPNEKKSIDDVRVCKICYNEELGVVFLPCGHMVACVKCAPGMTTCAVCREPVTMTVRAFLS